MRQETEETPPAVLVMAPALERLADQELGELEVYLRSRRKHWYNGAPSNTGSEAIADARWRFVNTVAPGNPTLAPAVMVATRKWAEAKFDDFAERLVEEKRIEHEKSNRVARSDVEVAISDLTKVVPIIQSAVAELEAMAERYTTALASLSRRCPFPREDLTANRIQFAEAMSRLRPALTMDDVTRLKAEYAKLLTAPLPDKNEETAA